LRLAFNGKKCRQTRRVSDLTATRHLSGRTPPALREVMAEWPLLSAPMAETLTGASRAAVQRNLAWMEGQGLIREVTGQGRFRMWRVAMQPICGAPKGPEPSLPEARLDQLDP
jgi:hypothetical protein